MGATAIILFVCALAYHTINKLTRRPIYTIEQIREHEYNREILLKQCHAQSITFETNDHLKLSGLLIIRPQAKRNIVLCHGYRMCKERLCCFASMFSEDNLLLFDHRAHGQSEGIRTTIGYDEKKDVLAALNVLQSHEDTKKLPVFGIGISMGAVSLLGAACENSGFKAIILDSPFAQLAIQARKNFFYTYKLPIFLFEEFGKKMFEYFMKFSLEEVNSFACAQRANLPIMIIHSAKDRVASIHEVRKIYEIIQSKKDFWEVKNSSHARIFCDFPEEYIRRINQFFNTIAI